MPTIAFFTPCGGGVDYELLLGSIANHAAMGPRVVLDNTPAEKRRFFKNLPQNVVWVYDDNYKGGSLHTCMFRQALQRALEIARLLGTDLVMHLDCDEFLDARAVKDIFPMAVGKAMQNKVANWGSDGKAHVLPGHSNRIWDARFEVTYPENAAWKTHPHYDGNPNRHPMPRWPKDAPVITIDKVYIHHLHYAVRQKDQYAFKENPVVELSTEWPPLIKKWHEGGPLPSTYFS